MKNRVREKLLAKEKVVGTFFELGGMSALECLGIAGLDFVIIDTEHGPFDVESAMDYIRAAELKNTTPFIRIKDITRPSILKMLDVGAKGLIIPCVEAVEQVKRIVEYGKYYPVGSRGFFFGRGAEYGFAEHAQDIGEYFVSCNENTMLIPQCETAGCLEHIEEIAAMEGVDGIFVGPYDLSIGLGIPAQFHHPKFQGAVQRAVKACKEAGKPILIYAGDAAASRQFLAQGFDGVAINTDASIYINAYRSLLREVRGSGEDLL